MVTLLVVFVPLPLLGLEPSTLTLPPRFMRLACPGVKALNESRAPAGSSPEGGEQEIGGERRRSELPRRWREMPLVELAGGPE